MWSSSWSSLETSILATQRKLGRLIIDETPGLRPCTGCWTRQNTPRPLRGPLQRTCGPRTARGAALESLAAPLAPKKMCVGAKALRARSAALSKVIVRTEQNNFAGGGAVAGLVLRAPVAARMWNKCFGRRKLTTIFCTGCWGLAKRPLRGALRRAGGRRTFRGTARGSVATPPVPAQCVRRPGRGGRIVDSTPSLRS